MDFYEKRREFSEFKEYSRINPEIFCRIPVCEEEFSENANL